MIFWIIAAGLIAMALLFLVLPILRQPHDDEATARQQQNVDIAKEKKVLLGRQLEQHELTEDDYESALHDLETSLALDLERDERVVQQQPGKWAIWLVIVVVPALSIALYLNLGEYRVIQNPALAEARPAVQNNAANMNIEAMLEAVKQRLRDNPDDAEGWFILGKTLLSEQQIDKAVTAFQRAYDLVGDQPSIMITLADALAIQNEGAMAGEPEQLVLRALALSPQNPSGLWLAGLAAEQRQDYKAAYQQWTEMLPLIKQDIESTTEVKRLLAILEKRDPEIQPITASLPVTASITLNVDLDPSLLDQTKPSDVVFVYAKAMNGPPMPLAVKRLTVGDLPTTVTLSDSDAMMATMTLSAFDMVIIGARVSKSGTPIAQTGDLFTELKSVDSKNSEIDLSLLIDQIK